MSDNTGGNMQVYNKAEDDLEDTVVFLLIFYMKINYQKF